MHEGWLMATDAERWTYRFHRDDKSWTRDPKVFVDVGRPMPDGSPALLKTRQHLVETTQRFYGRTCFVVGFKRSLLSGVLTQNPDGRPQRFLFMYAYFANG